MRSLFDAVDNRERFSDIAHQPLAFCRLTNECDYNVLFFYIFFHY